ncbi:TonB-dependent receptor [Halocola ammonii]
MRFLATAFFVLSAIFAQAQKGTINGTVIEDSNGQPIIGATVMIEGTSNGSYTDLDGNFSIKVEPGVYNLKVSFISFQTLTVEGVEVDAGETTTLSRIRLKVSSQQLEAAVVTAEATRKSEEALMTVKRKSVVMMDGISSEKMAMTGDGTAVEAAKRVTGVSIEGGKYVYVRGLGDRYSKTTLNGVDVPGLDPDKNTIQMDIFPTSLIDNITVNKNFTADMPADFTGGLLNIETKSFPDEKFLNVNAGIGYNPSMHFNSDYLAYEGGATDFLGFDDGTRALPAGAGGANIPTPLNSEPQQVNNFVRRFSPQLAAERQTSLMDFSAGVSFGNQIDISKGEEGETGYQPKLGYVFALTYKTDYRYYDDVKYGEYQKPISSDETELVYATVQEGELGERSVLGGILGGLAYKTRNSKYRLTAMRLQSGTSRAGIFQIDNSGSAVGQSGYFAESHNLEYNERSLNNLLINGTHYLDESGWEIDWRLSPTISTGDDPDIRKTAFTQTQVDTSFIAGAGGNPSRIWRSLIELNATAKIDVTKEYKLLEKDAKLKFGASHTYKQRDYEILAYDIQFNTNQDWPNPHPSEVLDPENLYPNTPNSVYYQSQNASPNPNAYESNVHNTGAYVSNEFEPFDRLNTIVGLRVENYVQRHTGRDQNFAQGNPDGQNLVNDKVLESLDFFPSAIAIFELNEMQNLRGSYSRTIARPSFKELSFAQILDPITNRFFNGALFAYEGSWDGNLTSTRIDNFDLRWELFQERGQLFSVSAFYKTFDNPIELVRIPEQQTSTEYQPRNVGDGSLYGVEFEVRKTLEFLSPKLENFSVSGNLTLVESQIDMTLTEFNARLTYEKDGQTIDDSRQMAGQAPWVINGGLSYGNTENGIDAGIYYNVKGPTLHIVGSGLFPDIYQEPFHSLNVSFRKTLGEEGNTSIDFNASNLLNDRREIFYQSYEAQEQIFTSFNPGVAVSLGISHKF